MSHKTNELLRRVLDEVRSSRPSLPIAAEVAGHRLVVDAEGDFYIDYVVHLCRNGQPADVARVSHLIRLPAGAHDFEGSMVISRCS